MPAPSNTDELLDLIQKSGVVDEARLRTSIQKLTESTGIPNDPARLATYLVRDAVLTYFQAEQLLQGKYKRFSIGKYKVLEKLGAGGMASVFLCEHKLMRRRVAIKVLPTAKADDPSSLQRFYREARAVAAVDHPNIVRAYDIDQDENLHFLVMEYVDGTNLHDLVKKFGPLDILRACHYIYGAAVGLQHAHEMGLIHRDIKPGNILIDRSGVVKILDMGLARFFHSDDDDALTKKYDENVLGTADYLAPEQALDSHTVDIRADIYSLGATFYYLLTASPLFPEGSVAQKLIWHQNKAPRPIRSLRADVPEEIVAIIDQMMAKSPSKRYQTPAELLTVLAPWVATPIPPPSEREMPQISLAAGGGGAGRFPASAGPYAGSFRPGMGGGTPDAPTVVASVPATPTHAIPTIPSLPAIPLPSVSPSTAVTTTPAPNSAVWESLEGETQSVAKEDTDSVLKKTEPGSAARKQPASGRHNKGPLIFVCIGFLVLVVTVGVVYLSFFNKKAPPELPPVATSHKFTVSSAGGDFTFPTLRAALTRVGPGDTIVITEAKLTEPGLKLDKRQHKDLTIESANPDRPVIIEAMDKLMGVMFDATDIEGLHLKNVEFDGKGTASIGIQLSGNCPGAMIENVSVKNVRTAAFQLKNAAGDANRPIVLDRVRAQSIAGDGISLTAANNVDNKRIVIRNSRFEGQKDKEGIGIRVDGPAIDLEIRGNRFFNLSSAVWVGRPPKDKAIKAKMVANTVYQANAGLFLEMTPPPPIPNEPPQPAGQLELAILNNYFGKTSEIGKVNGINEPVAGITATDNAFGPDCNPGNLGMALISLPSPLPVSTNPSDNDAKFLRFPSGPPECGPNKAKVGAP